MSWLRPCVIRDSKHYYREKGRGSRMSEAEDKKAGGIMVYSGMSIFLDPGDRPPHHDVKRNLCPI